MLHSIKAISFSTFDFYEVLGDSALASSAALQKSRAHNLSKTGHLGEREMLSDHKQ